MERVHLICFVVTAGVLLGAKVFDPLRGSIFSALRRWFSQGVCRLPLMILLMILGFFSAIPFPYFNKFGFVWTLIPFGLSMLAPYLCSVADEKGVAGQVRAKAAAEKRQCLAIVYKQTDVFLNKCLDNPEYLAVLVGELQNIIPSIQIETVSAWVIKVLAERKSAQKDLELDSRMCAIRQEMK